MHILIFILAFALQAFDASFAADMPQTDYETVSASQVAQTLGPLGGQGDILSRLVIVPATTGAGSVWITDGGGVSRSVYVSGTLQDLKTIVVDIGARSASGAWKVTTGPNVSVIAVGRFK